MLADATHKRGSDFGVWAFLTASDRKLRFTLSYCHFRTVVNLNKTEEPTEKNEQKNK